MVLYVKLPVQCKSGLGVLQSGVLIRAAFIRVTRPAGPLCVTTKSSHQALQREFSQSGTTLPDLMGVSHFYLLHVAATEQSVRPLYSECFKARQEWML